MKKTKYTAMLTAAAMSMTMCIQAAVPYYGDAIVSYAEDTTQIEWKDYNDIKYNLDIETKTLSIKGSGELKLSPYIVPWDKGNVENLVIYGDITSIGDECFKDYYTLDYVDLSNLDSLVTIGKEAFKNNNDLKKIKFLMDDDGNSTITEIRESAFENCQNLSDFILPKSIKKIEKRAFYYCTGIKNLTLPQKLDTIGESAFEGCHGIKKLETKNRLKVIGKRAFFNCTGIKSLFITVHLEKIQDSAFEGCSNLDTITFSPSTQYALEEIGEKAFYGTALEYADIPNSVKRIGHLAYGNIGRLKSVHCESRDCEFDGVVFANGASEYDIWALADNKSDKMPVSGWNGSTVEDYVEDFNKIYFNPMTFVALDKPDPVTSMIPNTTTSTSLTTTTTTSSSTTTTTTTTSTTTTTPTTTTTTSTTRATTKSTSATTSCNSESVETTVNSGKAESVIGRFIDGYNNWSFHNKNFYLTFKNYELSTDKFINAFETTFYKSNIDRRNSYDMKNWIEELKMESDYPGACFGMAVTSLISCYQGNDIHSLSPSDDKITDLVNYYFLLQYNDYIYSCINKDYTKGSEATNLSKLKKCVNSNSPTLVTYSHALGRHAVIVYDYEDVKDFDKTDYAKSVYSKQLKDDETVTGRFVTYDPAYNTNSTSPKTDYYIYITSQGRWFVPIITRGNLDDFKICGIIDDPSVFLKYGYSEDNDNSYSTDNSDSYFLPLLKIKGDTKYNIEYEKPKSLFGSDNLLGNFGVFAGTSDYSDFFVNIKEGFFGSSNKKTTYELQKDSKNDCVVSLEDSYTSSEFDMSMRYAEDWFNVNVTDGNLVKFKPQGSAEFNSENNTDYLLEVVSNYRSKDEEDNDIWYDISVAGNNKNVTLRKADSSTDRETNGYYIESTSSLGKINIKAVNNANAKGKQINSFNISSNKVFISNEPLYGSIICKIGDKYYENGEEYSTEKHLGDANCDGQTSMADAVLILQHLSNSSKYPVNEWGKKNADVNNAGNGLTAEDALEIQKMDSKMNESM